MAVDRDRDGLVEDVRPAAVVLPVAVGQTADAVVPAPFLPAARTAAVACARAAMAAGADFIKTSTGKISPAATLPVVHVMLQAVKDWKAETGTQRAVKPAGGIRTAKDAIRYLVAVHEVAGPEWLDPYYFRFGASSVLNDLIMQRRAQLDGHYSGADYVTVD